MNRIVAAVLFSMLWSCADDPTTLLVDLKTDLLPEIEFSSVETTLLEPGSDVGLSIDHEVVATGYLDGIRVAEYEGVTLAMPRIRVRLRGEGGALVAERETVVSSSSGRFAVTVLITRDCRGVACPMPGGSADATECFAGRCVPSDCSVENTAACGATTCESDVDCTATSACATFSCESGACLAEPIAGACTVAEYCSVEGG